jgi:hypothetical protein
MEHREIIEQLDQLNLSKFPLDIAKQYLKQLGKYGVIITTLHPGKRIIRARISEKASFDSVSKLSFKPQEYNLEYQRASTPNNTMFYGSIVPEISGTQEPETARITIIFELSEFVRNAKSIGEQDITFSAWDVIENIELVSLIHHKNFERTTKLSIELQTIFNEQIKLNPELKTPSLEISEYLANQFAKLPINKHSDYLISAAYSEIISELFDGVLYPSVRLAGEGINIAIKPDTVDNKLKFIGSSECTIYKNGKSVFVGNNTQSSLNGEGKLIYHKLDNSSFVSKEFGRKQVGLV